MVVAWNGALSEEIARSDPINEATLLGLRRDTNYSVSVRVRGVAAMGPPTTPIYCSTLEDGTYVTSPRFAHKWLKILT